MSEFECELACDKIAKEIVMVDDQYNSVVAQYENILDEVFSKYPSAQALENTSNNLPHPPKKDVLILGAGVAGLVTGIILQREGFNVTILEANRTRVGGRIKTFRTEEGREPPFEDPSLYAEAGAMRIPTSHPLVQTLINKLGLQTQPFYNVDVRKDDDTRPAGNTWVRANGIQERSSQYVSPELPESDRQLGFALPPKYKGKTAKELLDEALSPLIKATIPDTTIKDSKLRNKKVVEAWKQIIIKYDKYSMGQFLKEKYPEHVVLDYIGTLQNLTSRLFLSFIHGFVDTFYINPTTQYREIVGGNYRLPYELANKFGKRNIVMNARAIEIQWASPTHPVDIKNKNAKAIHRERAGVYVRTVGERVGEYNEAATQPMEREFTADYLVVSIPFSSLRFFNVNPLFSYAKNRAITELHYDSATKIFLEFNQRFWEWNEQEWNELLSDKYRGHNSIGGGVVTDSPNRFIYFPSHAPNKESKGGVILASYTWSDDANRWDSIRIEDRVTYALRGLTDIYGKGILRFYTGKCQTESWMENFYAFGEAAVFSPGQIIGLYPNVSTPEGPVHFAGEHASMKHAWIEGAIESAIRVSLEIRKKEENAAGTLVASNKVDKINEPSNNNDDDNDNGFREMTVASYLKDRLESLGVKRIFGVAGNYTAPFLDTILEDKNPHRLQITGTSNELCAGFAADGYARILGRDGVGVLAVTYGVGAFSVVNSVAGSFVEQVPVVVINGAPTNKEFKTHELEGVLFSHMLPSATSNIEVFRPITVAAERISNANEAQLQIDSVLTACINRRQPVYLEVLEDVWRDKFWVAANLNPIKRMPFPISTTDVDAAVESTLDLIKKHEKKNKAQPMFWAGIEIQRFGIQETFLSLLKSSGLHYTTAALGKSLVSEDTPGFSRVGLPQNASCVIGLGAWTTSKDIGNKGILADDDKAIVSQGIAYVGGKLYQNVSLKFYMEKLEKRLEIYHQSMQSNNVSTSVDTKSVWAEPVYPTSKLLNLEKHRSNTLWDYDTFFKVLNDQWIKDSKDTIVVVDASFSLIAAQQALHIKSQDGFVAQAAWLSIGYASPAAIGVKCAINDNKLKDKRVVVIAGDGAFQETCQGVSSYTQLNHNTVVFVLANGIYGIEQKIVNPNPFRPNPIPQSDTKVYEYNKLNDWKYEKLAEVFGGGLSHTVKNIEELEQAIHDIHKNPHKSFIVNVKIPTLSVPSVLNATLDNAGEDEINNPNWPPKDVF
ncbi:MAG: hypothetical protein FJX03_08205 [Alphaproteobacteria bacterium]|nr:hypothetical protein [Alphaproteobacteria bacterium]